MHTRCNYLKEAKLEEETPQREWKNPVIHTTRRNSLHEWEVRLAIVSSLLLEILNGAGDGVCDDIGVEAREF